MKEIWKDIKGYENLYQVSNLGKIKSLPRNGTIKQEKILKQTIHKNYLKVVLRKNGKKNNFNVHRLVALTFLKNPNNFKFVNHKDENKLNNNVDNLEWCTHKYNDNYGNRNSKISKALSIPINQYDLNGNFIKRWESATKIQKELGIQSSNICKCCKGKYKQTHNFIFKYAN